jgi:hypothetical protein
MIRPSLKTRERLISRLHRHGIVPTTHGGELCFGEPSKVCIPTIYGFSFIVEAHIPVMAFNQDTGLYDVLGGKISRLAVAQELEKMRGAVQRDKAEARAKVEDLHGEVKEIVESAYRIQVPISGADDGTS